MTNPPSDEAAESPEPDEPAAERVPPVAEPPRPPAGWPYPPVFAPVPRPPRMPWVNPARRGLVTALAAAVAVVLLGGGIGIGIAIAPSGNHHGPRFERGVDGFPGRYGRLPNAQFPGPGQHQHVVPAAPSSGSATPSSSQTR